MVINTSFGTIG